MHLLRSRTPLLAVLAVVAVTAGGCDILGPNADLAGYYNYAGTVYNSPGHSVNGQLDISGQYSNSADIGVDWNFYEGGQRIVHVQTTRSVPADIRSDGSILFTVDGRLQLADGTLTNFTLTHEGRRSGTRGLTGTWRLVTDLPSDDSGNFTATR